MSELALVIGANGGIGSAVVDELLATPEVKEVHTISRSSVAHPQSARHFTLGEHSQTNIENVISTMQDAGIRYRYVICTTGVLHGEVGGTVLKPEKRLEDINEQQLMTYFQVNSIIPGLWIRYLPSVLAKSMPVSVAFFSARVGSISDNKIGGWYGYRASKSALNMLIKTASVEYARRHKQVSLLAYHPGTVDTGLSKPFQSNVKPNKLFTPAFTAQRCVALCINASVENSPYYVDWDNQHITW